MRWEESDQTGRRVASFGPWCALDEIELRFPQRAGVYIFADDDQEVQYIGKAGAYRLKEEAIDARDGRSKGLNASQAKWLATNSDDIARSLETDLIAKYDPPNNKT